MLRFIKLLKVPDLPIWEKGPVESLKKLLGLIVPARIIYGYNILLQQTTSRSKMTKNMYYLVPTEQFLQAVYKKESGCLQEHSRQKIEIFNLSKRQLTEKELFISDLSTGEQSAVLYPYLSDVLQAHKQGLAFCPSEVQEIGEYV